MVILAYISYGVLAFILATVVGTWFASMKGQTNPHFVSSGFIGVMGLLFGIPCYLIGSYLRETGSESLSLFILLIAGSLGILTGLRNKA